MSTPNPPTEEAASPAKAPDWLQALYEESPAAIGFSRDGVMLDANAAYVKLFGYASAAELRGRSIAEQIAPAHRADVMSRVAARARGEVQDQRYETRGLRKDGTEFPFEVTTNRVLVKGEPLVIAFIADISDRAHTLAALRASEERFRMLSSAAFEGVFIHGEGKVLMTNEAGAAMYGFEADGMVGTSLMDLTAPESQELVQDHIRRANSEPYEGVARRKDGTTFIAEVRGRSLLLQGRPTRVATIRDITERRRVEADQRALAERVGQTQKLESLGVLAGGVAHDFNNILTVIANGVALAKRDSGLGLSPLTHLDAIALAAERAADLCRQMLAYAGKARLTREPVDLSQLANEVSNMLEGAVAKGATLSRDLAPSAVVLGDATQIRQIVMNLILNASEAIGGAGGTLRVSTGSAPLATAELAKLRPGGSDFASGVYAWLEVSDNGIGMDSTTVAQMFDPFFTTKFVGRGLGMAAVLGIARSHNAAIDVASAPGRGTTIRVFFPTSPATTSRATRAEAATPANVDAEERRLVLVVDDEKNVRISTERLLREYGFSVRVAQDGREALDVIRTEKRRFDAALIDLTMPGMGGTETISELRRIAPRLPIVLTSGYGCVRGQSAAEPDAVLPKPYTAERLLATLRGVIRQ